MRHHPNWQACSGGDLAVDRLVRATCRHGYLMESDNLFEMSGPDGTVRAKDLVALVYPHHGPLRCTTLHTRNASGLGPWEQRVSFPVLATAVPNWLRIVELVPANCPVVGHIVTQTLGGTPLQFFEPMYWGNYTDYQPGATCLCSLAGLALELEPRRTSSGRQTTTSAAPAPTSSERGQGGACPESRTLEYITAVGGDVMRCRGVVTSLDWHDFADVSVCRMLLALDLPGGPNPIRIFLYASETILEGYEPAAGDEIEAAVWMQGFLTSLPLIDELPATEPRFSGHEDAAEAFAYAWNRADLRCLSTRLARDVRYESPKLGVVHVGKEAVLKYLQSTIDRFAANRFCAFAELGQLVNDETVRPCVLVGIEDPDRPQGIITFDLAEGHIERIFVCWHCEAALATMVRRSGRYPR